MTHPLPSNHEAPAEPVARALRAHIAGGTVLSAVSGGADSMAMFHALCELARERPGLRVVAAHFDHRLRADSARDRETVETVARDFDVPVVTGEGDVADHARALRRSIEAAARELRYAFLERAASDQRADAIATAHTRSDHVETVLMRILRGAGPRGARGIHDRRGRIVRPLLGVDRADTRGYCEAHGVPFVDDPSNTDRRFLRNRIRHDVLPELRRVYPGIDAALERLSVSARDDFERAERAVTGRLDAHFRAESPGTWVLDLDALAGLDDADDRIHLLSSALDTINARDRVSRHHYHALLALARADARPGTSCDLPGTHVRREHDGLVFLRRTPRPPAGESATLPVPGRVRIGEWEIRADLIAPEQPERVALSRGPRCLGIGVDERRDPQSRSHERARFEQELVAFVPQTDGTLVVRFPRPGDRMRPFGMTGHKKLSDLFIDQKLPLRERARTPVVETKDEILWVAGVAASEATRVNGEREVVRLRATRIGAAPESAVKAPADA